MRAARQLEELASVSCACCGTPVPYRTDAPGARGRDARPRCVSCPTCGFKYRLAPSLGPGGVTARPVPL